MKNLSQASILYVDLDRCGRLGRTSGSSAVVGALVYVRLKKRRLLKSDDSVEPVECSDELQVKLAGAYESSAIEVAESARKIIEVDSGGLLTVSIGVASGSTIDTTIADLERAAERAMFDARARGGNAVSSCRPNMDGLTEPIRLGSSRASPDHSEQLNNSRDTYQVGTPNYVSVLPSRD